MLTTVGLPIAAPSANLSGKASPTNAQMVYDNLGDNVPMIIDGGESEAGIESTVVRIVKLPRFSPYRGDGEARGVYGEMPAGQRGWGILILRPGFITKEDLDQLFNHEIPVAYTTANPELSPGMRYKHYSISGTVQLIHTPADIICPSEKKI
jgi:L-threonylcarbamoyladenylate synthase